MGRAFIAFLIGAGLMAGVIEIYKRWERSQREQDPTDENDNYFIN